MGAATYWLQVFLFLVQGGTQRGDVCITDAHYTEGPAQSVRRLDGVQRVNRALLAEGVQLDGDIASRTSGAGLLLRG